MVMAHKLKKALRVLLVAILVSLAGISLMKLAGVPEAALGDSGITLRSYGQDTGHESVNCTIAKPAGLAAGDFMIAVMVSAGEGDDFASPDGWTDIYDADLFTAGAGARFGLSYKFATAEDAAASEFIFAMSSTHWVIGAITAWTGVNTEDPISNTDYNLATGTSVSADSITPDGANSVALIFVLDAYEMPVGCSGYAIASDNPASWTEAYDFYKDNAATGHDDLHLSLAYAERPETSASGAASATLSRSEYNAGILFFLNPASTTTVTNLASDNVSGGYANITFDISTSENGTPYLFWNKTTDPGSDNLSGYSDNKSLTACGSDNISSFINGLDANSLYYYMAAFLIGSEWTEAAASANLTTDNVTVPVVTTDEVSSYADTWALLPGDVVDAGGENCTLAFETALASEENFTDEHVLDGTHNAGSVSYNLTGLSPGTSYKFRLRATNTAGTGYSENGTLETGEGWSGGKILGVDEPGSVMGVPREDIDSIMGVD